MNKMSPTMDKALSDDAAVQLDGVTKRFGSVTAVADTWLKVRRGEFLTLLGPSGCGKTTLLNLIAGFLEPDAGELFIGGQRVTDTRPRQRSVGQQQRVALARALVINPDVLLLDEPLSALDKNLRAEMQVELKQIHQRVGITTVFVTHDQGEALSLSDRIAVMSNGVI